MDEYGILVMYSRGPRRTPDAESQNMVGYATNVEVNNPTATLPETGAFDGHPTALLVLAAAYFMVAAVAIKRFMRTYN